MGLGCERSNFHLADVRKSICSRSSTNPVATVRAADQILPILLLMDRELVDRAMEAAGGFWLAVVVMFVVMAVAEVISGSYRKRLFG